ncbi:MAG: DinB family protein [Fimbriimonadaceae bacterium]|nr:MAG: DinB family protein [Fimbriimonadaceae bacterium]
MTPTKHAIKFLLNEVLYGTAEGAEGTCFVQGDEALFAALQDLNAEEASRIPEPGMSSFAAHVIHTNYYLYLSLQGMEGNELEGDWPGSWAKQTVTAEEWREQQALLKSQVEKFCGLLDSMDFEEKWNVVEGIANVGHAAYHLGAIRQLYLLVKSKA